MPLIPPLMAPSIDDPIELLLACHEKVRRFTTLTCKLRDHVALNGADAQAAEAAQSILRYFDMAAPLHHEDEDLDLFPALMRLGHTSLNRQIEILSDEHDALYGQWQRVRPWLLGLTEGHAAPAPAMIDSFARSYQHHAQLEESELYPWAKHLGVDQIQRISQAMVRRRSRPQASI